MMVKNFFILQLGVKMKKSKRYIKKQNNKPLINKKVLAKVIRESNICKHAIKELKLAGYGNGEGGPNDWMYQQVIDNWIMAVDINNIDLIKLDINYNIQWKECSCLKGIRLEDVTVELEKEAYEELRNNK